MILYCVGVCFQGGSSAGWLCIVLVFVFRVVAVLGDSVLCWCLFSGWRQCWNAHRVRPGPDVPAGETTPP